MTSIPRPSQAITRAIESYPPKIRSNIMALRKLIYTTAARTKGVGVLTETLKWGEPVYLTSQSKSGSTLRIGWKKSRPNDYAMYFNCRTNLIESFRTLFPEDFEFEGNRAILLHQDAPIPADALGVCIEAALTYHLRKK